MIFCPLRTLVMLREASHLLFNRILPILALLGMDVIQLLLGIGMLVFVSYPPRKPCVVRAAYCVGKSCGRGKPFFVMRKTR